MKRLYNAVLRCFLIYAVPSTLLVAFPVLGQQEDKETKEYKQKVDEKLATLDLTGLKTKSFLNKTVFTNEEVSYYRKKPRDKKGK